MKLISHIWAEKAGSHIEVWTHPTIAHRLVLRVFEIVDGRETMITETNFSKDHCADIVNAFSQCGDYE